MCYCCRRASSCSFRHRSLTALAAALFPNKKREVCLSAPVVFEIEDDSPKMICEGLESNCRYVTVTSQLTTQVPHIPIRPDTPDTMVPSVPIALVELYAINEDNSIVADVGTIKGCWTGAGCIAVRLSDGGVGV